MITYQIQRTHIIGTSAYTYSAWERDTEHCPHSTITHLAGERYGQVSTRRLPAYIEAIPVASDAHLAAVSAWLAERNAAEHRLILAAFPEAAGGEALSTGGIDLERDPTLPTLANALQPYTAEEATR